MGLLNHDEFFSELTKLFTSREGKGHGAIYLVQKRYTPESPPSTPEDAETPPTPAPILIRATNGKSKEHRDRKVKISTLVEPDEMAAFYARYAEVCRGGMALLKPRDRKKGKAKARKKKVGGGGAGQSGMRAVE